MKKNLKVGITCSSFDLLHAGHVLMLEECKQHCDYLICALQVDPTLDRPNKNKPCQSVYERWVQLSAVKWVDKIIPYVTESELEDIFKSQEIHVRIIGEEYKNTDYTGKEICELRGIEIVFNKRFHNFSTTELRKRIAGLQTKS